MTIAFESAISLAQKIKDKEISSKELTEYFINRIEKYDEPINAVVVRDFDRALEAAVAADEKQAKGGRLGPLHGLPMTVKESYNIAGLPTHWGIEALKDNIAQTDAYYVTQLKRAGAVFMGKTNVPVSLSDFQSYNPVYGTTGNPWDVGRTPGGSSGGSAAALAAGFTGLEAGSDIGGSIRNPAHFCGVFGHKPTYGIVPWQGHELPGMNKMADLAVVGPLARAPEDLTLSMDLVAGAEPLNTGWKLDLPRTNKSSLKEFKVAIWNGQDGFPVSQETGERVEMVAETLAKAGATVSTTARPQIDINDSWRTYIALLNGALSASVPPDQYAAMAEMAASFSDDDLSDMAVSIRGTVQDHKTWNGLENHRTGLRLAWQAFFKDWDIVICPQMPTSAFPHDHSNFFTRKLIVDNQEIDYMQQLFWAGLTGVTYLPSTVFPTGPSKEGLPIGLQAVGGEFMDYQCIDFTRLLADEIGGFVAPPGFED